MIKADEIKSSEFKSYSKNLSVADFQWILMLFGTAVGAGIIFLPINAGMFGILPLIVISCFVFPLAFLPHLGINRFCLSSKSPDKDITEIAIEHFGETKGNCITLAYFASIYPTLLLYGIALTNTFNSLFVNQLGYANINRGFMSFVISVVIVGIMVAKEKTVLKIANLVVYPLILTLFGTSVYLIPQWSLDNLVLNTSEYDFNYFIKAIVVIVPTIVFSFNCMPAISSFAASYKAKMGEMAHSHTAKILARTTLLTTLFSMFFVFSCVLSLSTVEIQQAKIDNIPVLSIFASKFGTSTFSWVSQIISIAAICSSFFGHYMGASEGLRSIIQKITSDKIQSHSKRSYNISAFILFLSVWWASYYNFSVLSMIEVIVAPILATILYIFPVYAVYKLKEMKKYKSLWDIFTVGIGLLTIIGVMVKYFI